jgi:hypothetical protein
MRDWIAIAKASGLTALDRDLERTVAPLVSLEQAFRPLVKDLSYALEPAFEFRAGTDSE